MSRLAMRQAIAAFISEADLEYVGQVYAARPEVIPEQAYETNRLAEAAASEAGSSAVLVVNLTADNRQRRADTGRGAVNDSRIYKVVIELFFACTSGEAVKAQEDYDVIVDGIVNLIRENATLGAPGTVWSAGEYTAGVDHQQGEPYTDADGMVVFIPGHVSFESWEWIAGNV
jgi:hypothetical protein